jgi:hypothetical protein
MREIGETTKAARIPIAVPFFYGWFIVALSFLANLTAAGLRSAPSVLIHPLESEFGWGRTQIASAASLNLLLLGLMAPFGGWLIDRFGPRRVILGSLGTIAVGVSATVFVSELWQLIFLWGIVLGIATGVTPPLGASIASRWFVSRRGLAIGIMTNANAAGQVVFLPLLMIVIVASGWRSALMMIAVAAMILIPAIWLWMRDNPADIGLQPFRSEKGGAAKQARSTYVRGDIRPIALSSVSEVFKTSTFWLLAGCFFYLRRNSQRSHRHALDSSRHRKRHTATHRGDSGWDHGRSEFRRNHILGLAGGPHRSAKGARGSICAARFVAVYFTLRDRADVAVYLRRNLRPRLVRIRPGDDDNHRAQFWTRARREPFRTGFCFPSIRWGKCCRRRRVDPYAVW